MSDPTRSSAQQPGNPPRCDMCGNRFDDFNPDLQARCCDCFELMENWLDASSWTQLLNYNREFIRGDSSSTSYSVAPVFTDESLHPGLLRLHDYGLLVTDAQSEYEKVSQDMQHLGQWFEIKERAYIHFVVPTNHPRISAEKVENLQTILLDNENLELVSYYEYADYAKGKQYNSFRLARPRDLKGKAGDLKNIPKHKFFISSVGPSIAGRTVAKHRLADSEEGLKEKRWKKCKHNVLPVITEKDLPRRTAGVRALGRECTMTIGMKPIVITVAARSWPPTGLDLVGLIEQACKVAGMEPIFSDTPEKGKEQAKEDKKEGDDAMSNLSNLVEALSVQDVRRKSRLPSGQVVDK